MTTSDIDFINNRSFPLKCKLEDAPTLSNANGEIEHWKSKENYLQLERDRLTQENHSLQSKNSDYQSTINTIKENLQFQQNLNEKELMKEKKKLESEFNIKSNKFQIKEKGFLDEIERISLELSLTKKQVDIKDKQLEELKLDFDDIRKSETCISHENNALFDKLCKYQNYSRSLENNFEELKLNFSQSEITRNSIYQQYTELEKINSELSCIINDNSTIIQQLECELSQLKQELYFTKITMQNNSLINKGNSLFAEVDDHRKLVEEEYLNLKECYKSLETHYTSGQNLIRQLKTELAFYISQRGIMSTEIKYNQKLQYFITHDIHESIDYQLKNSSQYTSMNFILPLFQESELRDTYKIINFSDCNACYTSLFKRHIRMINYYKSRFKLIVEDNNCNLKKNIAIEFNKIRIF